MNSKDDIYREKKAIAAFRFDDQVASVFPDMIKRSVPGYPMMLEMISVIAQRFITHPGMLCYDLGCSLGASTLAISRGIGQENCKIIAVDNSSAMIDQAKQKMHNKSEKTNIEFQCEDINSLELLPHQLACMNFTLQFIPRENRSELLKSIYKQLGKSGALLLSEKIQFENPAQQKLLTELHHDFKRAHGYSDLEISQKRNALENVLIPESITEHIKRLENVGFSNVTVWFQCFNFVSLLAIKN